MKRFLQKIFCVFLYIIFSFANLYSQGQGPFNWTKPIKVESNDVFLQWMEDNGKTTHSYQKVYRFKIDSTFLPTDDLISKTPRHEDSRQQSGAAFTDVAKGKFNVSPYDEVIDIWESENGIAMMIPKFDTSAGLWTNTVQDSIYAVLSPYRIYVRTGDFDGDSLDEFVVSYVTKDDSLHFNIYDVDSTLHPSLITSYCDIKLPNYSSIDPNDFINPYFIETGDLNGDGKDEIILQGINGNLGVYVKIYELDGKTLIGKAGRTIQTEEYANTRSVNIGLVSGRFKNDNKDELAFLTEWYWQNSSGTPGAPYINDSYIYLLEASSDLEQINFDESKRVFLPLGSLNPPVKGDDYLLSIAAGDLNGDGRDEVVFATNNHIYTFSTDDNLNLTRKATGNIAVTSGYIGRFDNNFLKVSDVNQDNREEIIIAKELNHGFLVSMISANDNLDQLQLIGRIIGDENRNDTKIFAIAAGNFDGDNFSIGQPKHSVKNNIVQPVVILNAPPVHFDKFGSSVFDINSCYNGGDCNFVARYVKSQEGNTEVTTTVHKDWVLSQGVGASGSLGEGATINYEAHLLQKYGKHFNKDSTNSHTVSISVTVEAREDDQIYATVTNYDVWEYPLFHGNETVPRRSVLTVVPNSVQGTWFPSKSYNALNFVPNHEVGNILSYQDYSDPSNNPDLSQEIKNDKYSLNANSSIDWELKIIDFASSKADTTRENGIDAGVNFVDIVNFNYSNSILTTQTTSITKNIDLSVHLGSVNMGLGDVAYTVKPYAYWSKDNSLVVNYSVEPELAAPGFPNTWWQDYYGTNSDPTFILPWLYDPEKGFALSEQAKRYQTNDIIFSSSSPAPGDTLTITARVRNFSLVPTPSQVSVKFYVGDPDSGGTPIIGINGTNSASTIGPIPERGKSDIEFKWIVPSGLASYSRIYAVLDQENAITEIHENNNKGFNVLGTSSNISDIWNGNYLIPDKYVLYQSYPNPFNPTTKIRYSIPSVGTRRIVFVQLKIYDVLGNEVATLINEEKPSGNYEVEFNGSSLSSGIYFYQLHAGNFLETRKMVLMK